ncbi:MAG: enoyl-CoA hydratase [Actinomycetota bacterium]|jgi:enoyl-CoA hydratase/carnithine racemase|nr:enoyl-CoA hydratase [Actinomycetota bacterium]
MKMNTLTLDRPRPEVVVVTLDRPDRLNAITFEMVDELHAVLDDLDRDNSCRVVVLTGAGRGFCSGLDLKEITPSSRSVGLKGTAAGLRSQAHIAALVPHLRAIPQPVIAAINGHAYGGGLALACGCDLRVAAESAQLCVQFIKVGLGGCDIGISYTLPRLVGASRAHDLILTARVIDAIEAERIGLVSRVVRDGEALNTALEIADTLCGYSPFGLTITKEVMWANVDTPDIETAIDLENRNQILATTTGDIERAVTDFTQRSKPSP